MRRTKAMTPAGPDWLLQRIYEGWIEEHIPKDEVVGNCTIWARVMREAFPELIHVGGYVRLKVKESDLWGDFWSSQDVVAASIFANHSHYHEYLRTQSGEIVDPTGKQFGSNYEYIECEEHLII
jgi:hypothetical protein